eukprot:scaffold7578_cov121-Isochrysis_galbana.AAC.9
MSGRGRRSSSSTATTGESECILSADPRGPGGDCPRIVSDRRRCGKGAAAGTGRGCPHAEGGRSLVPFELGARALASCHRLTAAPAGLAPRRRATWSGGPALIPMLYAAVCVCYGPRLHYAPSHSSVSLRDERLRELEAAESREHCTRTRARVNNKRSKAHGHGHGHCRALTNVLIWSGRPSISARSRAPSVVVRRPSGAARSVQIFIRDSRMVLAHSSAPRLFWFLCQNMHCANPSLLRRHGARLRSYAYCATSAPSGQLGASSAPMSHTARRRMSKSSSRVLWLVKLTLMASRPRTRAVDGAAMPRSCSSTTMASLRESSAASSSASAGRLEPAAPTSSSTHARAADGETKRLPLSCTAPMSFPEGVAGEWSPCGLSLSPLHAHTTPSRPLPGSAPLRGSSLGDPDRTAALTGADASPRSVCDTAPTAVSDVSKVEPRLGTGVERAPICEALRPEDVTDEP